MCSVSNPCGVSSPPLAAPSIDRSTVGGWGMPWILRPLGRSTHSHRFAGARAEPGLRRLTFMQR